MIWYAVRDGWVVNDLLKTLQPITSHHDPVKGTQYAQLIQTSTPGPSQSNQPHRNQLLRSKQPPEDGTPPDSQLRIMTSNLINSFRSSAVAGRLPHIKWRREVYTDMVGMVVESGGWSCCGVSGSLGAKKSDDEKRQSGLGIPTVTSAAGDFIRFHAGDLANCVPSFVLRREPLCICFSHRLPLRPCVCCPVVARDPDSR
jgi:hypothetical protein